MTGIVIRMIKRYRPVKYPAPGRCFNILMMRQIQKEGVEPTVISAGEVFTLDDWYKDDEEKSIEELMSLRDKGRDGHNAVNKYIHANK